MLVTKPLTTSVDRSSRSIAFARSGSTFAAVVCVTSPEGDDDDLDEEHARTASVPTTSPAERRTDGGSRPPALHAPGRGRGPGDGPSPAEPQQDEMGERPPHRGIRATTASDAAELRDDTLERVFDGERSGET